MNDKFDKKIAEFTLESNKSTKLCDETKYLIDNFATHARKIVNKCAFEVNTKIKIE